MQIKTQVQKTILRALIQEPASRDSDRLLMVEVWSRQAKEKDLKLADFLIDFLKGEYTNPETIRRTRQKLQQDIPNVRGESYRGRIDLGIKVSQMITDKIDNPFQEKLL